MVLVLSFLLFLVAVRLPWVWWWEKVNRFCEIQRRAIDAEETLSQQRGNASPASFDDRRRSTKLVIYGVAAFICFVYMVTCAAVIFTFQIKEGKFEYFGIGAWGPVGDFFGGMLNPILAFASFIALLYTIRIQSEELRLTREELTQSRIAQQSLVEQAKVEHKSQSDRERYNVLLRALVDSNDQIKSLLDQTFSKANPYSMPDREKCLSDIVAWIGAANVYRAAQGEEAQSLNEMFKGYVSEFPDLFTQILVDVTPILRECKRLKVIASEFEALCLGAGMIFNTSEQAAGFDPENFEQLILKDAARNINSAHWLSETFHVFM